MGKMEIQKIWISRERKEILDEIKNIFIVFQGVSFVENENLLKDSGHKL